MMQPPGRPSDSREGEEQRAQLPPPELSPLAAASAESNPAPLLPAGSSQQHLEPETPVSTPVAMPAGGGCSLPAQLPQHCSYRGLLGACMPWALGPLPATGSVLTGPPLPQRCSRLLPALLWATTQLPCLCLPGRCSGEGRREVARHCEAQGHTRGRRQVGGLGCTGQALPLCRLQCQLGRLGRRDTPLR